MASYARDPPAANQAVMPGLKLQICVRLAEFLADLMCTVSVHVGVMECQQYAWLLIMGTTALAPGAGRQFLACLLCITHVNVIDMVISIVVSCATGSAAAWSAMRVGFYLWTHHDFSTIEMSCAIGSATALYAVSTGFEPQTRHFLVVFLAHGTLVGVSIVNRTLN